MSHDYLLDTYTFIQQRLDEVQQQLTDADADQRTKLYAAGQIEVLCELDRFLKEHYDAKLPRRLRQRRQQMAGRCAC